MSVPVSADLERAAGFLDGLLADLYRRSGAPAGAPLPPSPIPIVDDPLLARQVLARPDVFVKNYAFLDNLARGRFSTNGEEWRRRAALTRDWYRDAHRAVDADAARAVYARHLEEGGTLHAPALFERFTAAAVEIFSRAIGLAEPLAWPADLVGRMRETLLLRQWIDWHGCAPPVLARVQRQLEEARGALRAAWQADPAGARLLVQLQERGMPVPGFDAAEELIQNLLASSETTASSLLWAAEALSREPALQARLASAPDELERFILEVLRLFPPVPYLTRRCNADVVLGETRMAAGAVLSISIVGIHRHPAYWRAPMQFDPSRAEFDLATPPAYMPFSRGERVCAGMRLARIELRAGLEALLAQRRCIAGAAPTRFGYGLSSTPKTALQAVKV